MDDVAGRAQGKELRRLLARGTHDGLVFREGTV